MRLRLSRLTNVFRGLLSSKVEENLWIRLIVLAMGWWVSISLASVGSPAWIWVGGIALLTAGHAFSWYLRHWKSRFRSIIVGAGIIGALALVQRTVMLALNGDWLPVAHLMLLFQGVTGFELRTRGGLYTSIAVSGVIFFIVSQTSLAATFGVFLVGYITLLLSFFAMSALADQSENAEVRWFRSRFGFAGFWSAVSVVSLLLAAGIFMILPKQLDDALLKAEAAVLPVRGDINIDLPDVSTGEGPVASALPMTLSDVQRALDMIEQISPDLLPGDPAAMTTEDGQRVLDRIGELSPEQLPRGLTAEDVLRALDPLEQSQSGAAGDASATGRTPEGTGTGPTSGGDPGDGSSGVVGSTDSAGDGLSDYSDGSIVMQVRSRVLTYWRGQTYATFDGSFWYPDPAYLYVSRSWAAGARYRSPEWRELQGRPLYPQTYYLKEDAPPGHIFTGYTPVLASVPLTPSSTPDLSEGAVYRVVSALPRFSTGELAGAFPRSRMEQRYHDIPDSLKGIRIFGEQITPGAFSDFDRSRRIVRFLENSFEFDEDAPDQLVLTRRPNEFLERGGTGTSMDFATATVMLARAAGIPSRLVTGYLPGAFDPLSGTYLVSADDRHAWAELYFPGSGWVPFDSAPRAASAAFSQGVVYYRDGWINSVFGLGYGEGMYGAVIGSPATVADAVAGVGGGGPVVAILAVAAVVIVLTALAIWKLPWLLRRRRGRPYTSLPGEERTELLKLYASAERMLRKAGVAARTPAQTLTEFAAQAEATLGSALADFTWLRTAAEAAAYDPKPQQADSVSEASARLVRLKAELKAFPSSP